LPCCAGSLLCGVDESLTFLKQYRHVPSVVFKGCNQSRNPIDFAARSRTGQACPQGDRSPDAFGANLGVRRTIGERSPILAGLDIELNAPMVGLVHNVIEG